MLSIYDLYLLPSFRIYICARCYVLTMVCTPCDRGQVYCPECAVEAWWERRRRAGRKYQSTDKGKKKHAARQAKYRMGLAAKNEEKMRLAAKNEEKVTHRGSARAVEALKLKDMSNGCPAAESERPSKRPHRMFIHHFAPPPVNPTGLCHRPTGRRRRRPKDVGGLFTCSFCGRLCGPLARVGFLSESTLPAGPAGSPRLGGSRRGRKKAARRRR